MPPTPSTVVVARTTDGIQAQIWVDMLHDEGIDASTYQRGVQAALGGVTGIGTHLVLVHRDHVGDARNVIAEAGGASALAPIPSEPESHGTLVRALFAAVAVAVAFFLLLVVFQAGG